MPPRKPVNQVTENTVDRRVEIPDTARARILMTAMNFTHHDRNANYGNPEDNFQHIANLWDDYLGVSGRRAEFTPADVAIMCMLIKIARLGNNSNHWDSAVDVAGYAACLGDCIASQNGCSPDPL